MSNWCIAHTDIGVICGELATQLDPQRGGMVCAAHVPGCSEALPTDIQQAESASSKALPAKGSRLEALRTGLAHNKIFFETIAASALAFMAIVVSVIQLNISDKQTRLAELQTKIA
jgi:hypothetical protein